MENTSDNWIQEEFLDKHPSGMDLLFGKPFEGLEFVDLELDFEIDPDHFMRWLEMENDEENTGDYAMDCASMCEYSCLFICMLLNGKKLQGKLEMVCGQFGFWEHYWMQYTLAGEVYFIDLTLKQFKLEAPKLSIVKAINKRVSGCYNFWDDIPHTKPKDYLREKNAFVYYNDPNCF